MYKIWQIKSRNVLVTKLQSVQQLNAAAWPAFLVWGGQRGGQISIGGGARIPDDIIHG